MAAGDRSFARGEDYVRYVRGLRIADLKAYASIQAKNVYQVELDWSGPLPDGFCTCRHHADGNFCKHLVATGLAAIDTGRVAVDDTASSTADASLQAAVQAMDVDELRELVMTLVQRDDGVRRLLEIRATTTSGDDWRARADLEAHVRSTLEFRGFIDYRRSFEVAEVASDVLDELEDHVNSGAADVARPASLLALTRLRKILEHVDDSSGSIGDQCQRAADLYALACRLSEPDPVKLATWLVKFRAESPGWPHLVLADFVDAFDEKALGTYRRAVAALDRKLVDQDQFGRFEVDAMLLELADHDGDVDRAVHLLAERDHPQYGAIVDRLRAAGRTQDAVAWIDRAVAEGRFSSHVGGNAYWLSPDDVARTYQGLGRIDDAVGVLRADFVRQPSVGAYRVLLDFAEGIDRVDDERAWALDHARHQAASDRFAAGAVLVQLCLSDGDVEAAWQAADRYGPGWAWRELADRGAKARPVEAADLYRPVLEKDLRYPDSKLYPDIAARLATMAKLYEKAGRSAAFASYIAQIRQDYGRRPSLMKALD
ncbi:MAG: zinc finger, domain protein, partial [Mycobacterium sp.]|nr:zinc finger, domain protein [Mycobacterium sp.]